MNLAVDIDVVTKEKRVNNPLEENNNGYEPDNNNNNNNNNNGAKTHEKQTLEKIKSTEKQSMRSKALEKQSTEKKK